MRENRLNAVASFLYLSQKAGEYPVKYVDTL